MSRVMAGLSRNCKVLAMAEKRAKIKVICLLDKLEEEEELERKKNDRFIDGELIKASFNFPSFLGIIDGLNVVDWSALDVPGGNPIETRESSRGAI